MGVTVPGAAQLENAILAASREVDEPLDEPTIDISVPTELVIENVQEEPSELEQDIKTDLQPISLEEKIQSQTVQNDIEQFGYDIFNTTPTTFAPVESIPVPPDYLIGPGDTLIVKIYGAVDVEYRLVVNREGQLLIPELGDLQLAGLSFLEAKTAIQEAVNKSRIGAKSVVTLAELHTIQILMVGEVARPGSYTVSGLSSLLNTLITTGGIKRSGTLRDIQVKRAGEIIARLDLYGLLLEGQSEDNIYLRHGDVVFVPSISKTIGVAGEVLRPAIYELKDEQTLAQIVQLAGNYLPKADPSKSLLERYSEKGFKTLINVDLNSVSGKSTRIQNGDILRVFPVLNKMDDVVLLSGHVLEPGGYEYKQGMQVTDIIKNSQQLRQSVDTSIALIQRENKHKRRLEALYFDLGEALADPLSAHNLKLQPRDQITIFDTSSSRESKVESLVDKLIEQSTAFEPPKIFQLAGSFRHTGGYPLQIGMRLLDATVIGGGIPPSTDLDYALLLRTSKEDKKQQFIQINLRKAYANKSGDHNPVLQELDKIYIFDTEINRSATIAKDIAKLRSQAGYKEPAKVVTIAGKSNNNGEFPLTPGMKLKDLLKAAGGLKESAFGIAANLTRRELIADEFSVTDNFEISLSDSAEDGYDTELVLQPYDFVTLREKPEWIDTPKMVTIEGEVLYPGSYQVQKRETLCSLVNRAGGFTEDAYLFGAVFLRESVRKREQEALDEIFDNLDDTLVDVHLSPGYTKDTKLPAVQGTTDTYRVLKHLKRKKAIGRLVIDLEKAVSHCSEEYDLVLEDSDRLIIPKFKNEVSVVGQVYQPQSHMYRSDRAALDYVNLSGGTKEYAQREHIYIYQANGEIMTIRSPMSTWGWAMAPANVSVTPGSTIYVPISLDRINGREFAQSWVDLVFKTVMSVSSISYIFK
jgi:protein involved in polysaccharide export with SLBB domain